MSPDYFPQVLKAGIPTGNIRTSVHATNDGTKVLKRVTTTNAIPAHAETALNAMGNEIARNTVASELGIAPKLYGEIETPDSLGFIQEHGGKTFASVQDQLTPRQNYYIGHQAARLQRRGLQKGGFLLNDRNPENIVLRNLDKAKPTAKMIDYEVVMPSRSYMSIPEDMRDVIGYPSVQNEPFLVGYDTARNFRSKLS